MTEIITQHIEMPEVNFRKFTKHPLDLNGKKWIVKNGDNEIYKGSFQDASLICYNKNKFYYSNPELLK